MKKRYSFVSYLDLLPRPKLRERIKKYFDREKGSINIKALREELGLSQSEFAEIFRIKIATLQAWEQGINIPSDVAKAYLMMIMIDPKNVYESMNAITDHIC